MGRIGGRPSAQLVSSVLQSFAAPIFGAAWSIGRVDEVLLVHVAATPRRTEVKQQILKGLNEAGVKHAIVRFHNAAQLDAPRSLERLIARFGGDDIAYDPTGSLARAKTLVNASRAIRGALNSKLAGLYYAPRVRTLYVTLRTSSIGNG